MVCKHRPAWRGEKDCAVTAPRRKPNWLLPGLLLGAAPLFFPVFAAVLARAQALDWQAQVRHYAEVQDWAAAMRVVDQEIARAPVDMDVREWRARVFTWSGRLAEAEQEYLEILKVARTDPDKWMGLATVYGREGKSREALRALDTAVELDSKRADIHTARARALRSVDERAEAKKEFQKALALDPGSAEARAGLVSVRGERKNEVRVGNENDLFNFTRANHGEWMSLLSQWTPSWTIAMRGDIYQRGGTSAGKVAGSVT